MREELEDEEVGCCAICGFDVPPRNDAVRLELLAKFHDKSLAVVFSTRSRHLFPVIHGNKRVCKGTPDMAQYLEGQPRDFSSPYDPKKETPLREAFKKMREKTVVTAEAQRS